MLAEPQAGESQSAVESGFSCSFPRSYQIVIFFFTPGDLLAGFISKFQEKPGWWGSMEWDRQLTAELRGDRDHRGA